MQNAVKAEVFLQSLALAVARNNVGAAIPIDHIVKLEGLTLSEYYDIEPNPTFQRYLAKYEQELTDSGFSFEAKSRLLAEDMLPGFYNLGRDMDTPAAVRAKIMESLVKWGRLEPKTDVAAGGNAGFSISINLPDPSIQHGVQSQHHPQQQEPISVTITPNTQQVEAISDYEGEGYEGYEGEDILEGEYSEPPQNLPAAAGTTETAETKLTELTPEAFDNIVPLKLSNEQRAEVLELKSWVKDFLDGGDEATKGGAPSELDFDADSGSGDAQ